MTQPSRLPLFDYAQRLPGGFRMPARMTALPLANDKLALVSPVPITDASAARIAQLGQVQYLIAPNLLHHLYLGDAQKRFPNAVTLAPRGLRKKRPDLKIDGDLEDALPADLAADVAALHLAGAPGIDEFVFFHRASRTLVVTDLVFNIVRPEGLLAHLFLFMTGCHGHLAHSRVWIPSIKDKAAFAHSLQQLFAFPFEALVVAHGEPIYEDTRARLAIVMRKRLPAPHVLPAAR